VLFLLAVFIFRQNIYGETFFHSKLQASYFLICVSTSQVRKPLPAFSSVILLQVALHSFHRKALSG
jgi:hypothetical protein